MIRIAAVGDIHMGPDTRGVLRPAFDTLHECADLLLLAGDLTRHGTVEEARVVADEIRDLAVPVVAVLGNHDHHDDRQDEVTAVLRDAGARVLEGESTVVRAGDARVGVAGTKGFGGGFVGASAGEFGEPVMKEFVRVSRHCADGLRTALERLDEDGCDVRIALTHYSPVPETLAGEPLEIYPFLGSYLLAEAIDTAGADLAVHGHAHAGSEHGMTTGGVRVRNVAQPVIGRAFHVYHLPVRHPAGTRSGAEAVTG
ncbi:MULTISPECIES: metallophosphoesterase family protein [Streptomyces]|jgi:Icc-related predicted phosphoesterase|uniref:Icc-related predicted phosphoesterase n=2 Tax=Streptomyces TaxID=1883 RepID=A0AA40SK70_9ACTN|nr:MULTISPECIES: metallophosphoesterase [Streptomyces]MBA8947964.1 Icc-related predicted phosphoesterase [Streptomyces calvus]MBA8976500.1 Icc-related predicted phosphoesterase [Streptomyces calvus]MYS30599.1 metallophosphoesterase [Streptomyces sp. SID7804]GGP82342.1 metallophosphoesterase [Streptomyces calvus]